MRRLYCQRRCSWFRTSQSFRGRKSKQLRDPSPYSPNRDCWRHWCQCSRFYFLNRCCWKSLLLPDLVKPASTVTSSGKFGLNRFQFYPISANYINLSWSKLMMPRHTISVPEANLLNLYGSLKIRPSVLSVPLLRMRINKFIEETGLLLTNYSHKSMI